MKFWPIPNTTKWAVKGWCTINQNTNWLIIMFLFQNPVQQPVMTCESVVTGDDDDEPMCTQTENNGMHRAEDLIT